MNEIIDSKAIKKAIARITQYAEHSHFQQEIAERLLARLPFMKIQPRRILDCGGDQFTLQALQKNYPEAEVVQHPITELNNFAYGAASFDFVFANLSLHWAEDMFKTLAEFRRLIKQDGLLLFSTLGPDTLTELHQAFLTAEDKWHVHPFMDMHPIGDEVLRLQFFEPVIDMEKVTLHYESLDDLFLDLKNTGTQNALTQRSRGLQGKNAWQKMLTHYVKTKEGYFPVTAEVIYGQAWVNGPRLSRVGSDNEVVFSLEDGLPRR